MKWLSNNSAALKLSKNGHFGSKPSLASFVSCMCFVCSSFKSIFLSLFFLCSAYSKWICNYTE